MVQAQQKLQCCGDLHIPYRTAFTTLAFNQLNKKCGQPTTATKPRTSVAAGSTAERERSAGASISAGAGGASKERKKRKRGPVFHQLNNKKRPKTREAQTTEREAATHAHDRGAPCRTKAERRGQPQHERARRETKTKQKTKQQHPVFTQVNNKKRAKTAPCVFLVLIAIHEVNHSGGIRMPSYNRQEHNQRERRLTLSIVWLYSQTAPCAAVCSTVGIRCLLPVCRCVQ